MRMTKKQREEADQAASLEMQALLNQDIVKRSFKSFTLLFGEETYLRKQFRDKMKAALADGTGELNTLSAKGTGIDPQELVNFAETVPFLASHRTVIVEESGFFKNGCDILEDYFKQLPATCYFLFVEESVNKNGTLFKRVADRGRVVPCIPLSEAKLRSWVIRRTKDEDGKQIRENAAQSLIERTGTEMLRIENERQKLVAFCGDREEITRKDVEQICSVYLKGMIFEMTDAIADGNRRGAMELYLKMLRLQEKPERILYFITRQFRQLLVVAEMIALGSDPEEVAQQAGIQKFLYRKYADWCARFRIRDLQHCVDLCLDAERDYKSGRMDKQIAIETLIARATMPAQSA